MAITRTHDIDDDGTGNTGTIRNAAWKEELYDQIDAYAALLGPSEDIPFFNMAGPTAERTFTFPDADATVFTSAGIANTALKIYDTNASHFLSIVPGSDLTADRVFTLVTGDAARTVTLSGNPTLADWFDQSVKAAASPVFAAVKTAAGGLQTLDTNASHYLKITAGSNITADRTLTIVTGDSDRTVTYSGNPTLADWFDQSVKAASSPTFVNVSATAFNAVNLRVVTQVYAVGDSLTSPGVWTARLESNLGTSWNVNNKGIASRRTTQVLAGLTADVITPDDGTYAVVLVGINDVAVDGDSAVTVEGRLQSIYSALKAAGLTVVAVSILPFKTSTDWSAGKQTIVDTINTWMDATATDVDYYVDAYAALEDPGAADTLLAAYDSGDHVHQSTAGYNALGDAIHTGVTWTADTSQYPIQVSGPDCFVGQDLRIAASPSFFGVTILSSLSVTGVADLGDALLTLRPSTWHLSGGDDAERLYYVQSGATKIKGAAPSGDSVVLQDINNVVGLKIAHGGVASAPVGLSIGGAPLSNFLAVINGTSPGQGGLAFYSVLQPAANEQAFGLYQSWTINEAASGTHPLLAGAFFGAPTVVAGGATVTDSATVYIVSAMSATVSGRNYALWVAGGLSRFDGGLAPASVTFGARPTGVPHGTLINITDSTTGTRGAVVAGGGGNHVLARFDGGSSWIVV